MRRLGGLLGLLLLGGMLCLPSGCTPVSRHKVLTTIFDGVPSLPPPEQLCAEYVEKMRAAASEQRPAVSAQGAQISQHPPYAEHKCGDCHDKRTNSGLVRPIEALCLYCHRGFIKGTYVHGPVAVRDCTACHDPHSSTNPALLKYPKNVICSRCHQEERLAALMHKRAAEHNLGCLDCHNPHYGNGPFFLE